MKTRDFIRQRFNLRTTKTSCSSVISDDNGNIFSYGFHYPLLFTVGDKIVRNVSGYSNTTQRHILWSRDVDDAIDIHAPDGFRLSSDDAVNLAALLKSQRNYISRLQEQMDAKKRKDTMVYKLLELEHARATANLAALVY